MRSRYLGLVLIVPILLLAAPSPAQAKCPSKVLGRDAAGDASADLDLTALMALRCGPDLGVMFFVDEVSLLSPKYSVVHVRWAFDVDDRTFLVEAETTSTSAFTLYELRESGPELIGSVRGYYDSLNDVIGISIPMSSVGATVGSRVSGADGFEGEDAIFAVSVGTPIHVVDSLGTRKTFIVPRWR
ncbi:MAG: hypothetical protein ABR575_00515 [Actinomycetota bacterium]